MDVNKNSNPSAPLSYEELKRLRLQWVTVEAHRIQEATGRGLQFCMQQAWLAWRLLSLLGSSTVWFTYTKENGDLRHAKGTLCPAADADFAAYEARGATRPPRDDCTHVYWDMGVKGFRTFHSYRLVDIITYDHEE